MARFAVQRDVEHGGDFAVAPSREAALEAALVDAIGLLRAARPHVRPNPDIHFNDRIGEFLNQASVLMDKALTHTVEQVHPEDFCERCRRANLPAWWIASNLWNATVRSAGGDEWSVLCPQCFAELAEAKGVVKQPIWELRLYKVHLGKAK